MTIGTPPLTIVRSNSDDLGVERYHYRLLDLSDLAKLPKPIELVEGLVPDPSLTFLNGAPGAGKSLVALDAAMSIATFQGQWFGRKIRGGPVVYALGEGLFGLKRRVDAWAYAHPDTGAGPIAFCGSVPDLCNMVAVVDFVDAIIDRPVEKPALVVIDTLSRAIAGADENSAQEMSQVVKCLDFIRISLGCTVLVLHHTGKDTTRGGRGSSVLSAAADAELNLQNLDGLRVLRPSKMRDGTLDQRLAFRLVPALGSVHLALDEHAAIPSQLTDSQETALAALRKLSQPAKTKAWQDAAGLAASTFHDARRGLAAAGWVLDGATGYSVAREKAA